MTHPSLADDSKSLTDISTEEIYCGISKDDVNMDEKYFPCEWGPPPPYTPHSSDVDQSLEDVLNNEVGLTPTAAPPPYHWTNDSTTTAMYTTTTPNLCDRSAQTNDKIATANHKLTSSLSKKEIQCRKAKKALGWAYTVLLFPLAMLTMLLRQAPTDRDDPYDWYDDPLRPWRYKVKLDMCLTTSPKQSETNGAKTEQL